MTLEWTLAVVTFAVASCFTPGPNNTMLMASGLNFGFVRSVPHVLGVTLGFAVMVLAVALGVSGIFAAFPQLYTVLKVVSVIYLAWLAWRIAMSSPKLEENSGSRPFTFFEAAAFQWVNPKGWVMALGASTTYVVASQALASVVAISVIFAVAGLGSSSSWAAGGTALRRIIGKPGLVRAINIGLALLLLASLWPTLAEILSMSWR
ncbi:MAG: LysE family translocator [Hyphomicrobiaceae bacterium]|nr:LysE family translocator [Hyphomicrobiaceae bacterium]